MKVRDGSAAKFSLDLEEEETGTNLLHSALFTESGRLKPVYGKPVDIHDIHGNLATVCLWSYPLTPAACASKERKASVVGFGGKSRVIEWI